MNLRSRRVSDVRWLTSMDSPPWLGCLPQAIPSTIMPMSDPIFPIFWRRSNEPCKVRDNYHIRASRLGSSSNICYVRTILVQNHCNCIETSLNQRPMTLPHVSFWTPLFEWPPIFKPSFPRLAVIQLATFIQYMPYKRYQNRPQMWPDNSCKCILKDVLERHAFFGQHRTFGELCIEIFGDGSRIRNDQRCITAWIDDSGKSVQWVSLRISGCRRAPMFLDCGGYIRVWNPLCLVRDTLVV